ncbi:formyl-CoA transferase [Actinocorallia herbida]|uniref:Formyl-CoA transferase n=1 Tax=Actinocorallia herbida TaxID=58109 RepID=A0A3N1D325_9ACTN|nr:CoA transferase [Actinocorallia herbida]ROO87935.1 formyl-CoA transferase [Actinocorallia herbida]
MTKPFTGIKVLEVAAWTFVPAAGAVLADLGADVIKVEPPNGDPQRALMNLLAQSADGGKVANPFLEIPNRGKRSITLDLNAEKGRETLLRLAEESDVFLTSYLPAVRAKLGITADDLRAVNPNLIYAAGSGWGRNGPMADQGAYDLAAAWASSSMAFKMSRGGTEPIFQPAAFFDLLGGNTIAGAVGGALFHRERTGEAVDVDVSLLNMGMWALSPDITAGPHVGQIGAPPRDAAPNPVVNSYATADGRWLYLVLLQADRFWAELCQTIDRPDLIEDPRFTDLPTRAANARECVAELDATFARHTLDEWRTRFKDFTGVWAPVLSPAEVHDHVQVSPNGLLASLESNDGAPFRLPVSPMHFGGEPGTPEGPAPELGQHTELLLLENGFDWDQITALREAGAFG